MDHGRNGIVCVTSGGVSLAVNLFYEAVKDWYGASDENRKYVQSFAKQVKKDLKSAGLQQLKRPEPLSLDAVFKVIQDAMNDQLSGPFQMFLNSLSQNMEEAIEEIRAEHENELVRGVFEQLEDTLDFDLISKTKFPPSLDSVSIHDPLYFLATAAACSQFAEAAKENHPLSEDFVNPLWGKKSKKKRLLSDEEYQALLRTFLPLLEDPVSVFHLLFWNELRELANSIAHPSLPPKTHYDHFFNETWMLESGRSTFSAVFSLAQNQGDTWAKIALSDRKQPQKRSRSRKT